jgi:hypothetical protein
MPFSAEKRTTVTQQLFFWSLTVPKLYIEYLSIFKPYTKVCLVNQTTNRIL